MNFQENQFGSISCMVTLMQLKQPKNVVKVANPSAFVVCMHDYKSYCSYLLSCCRLKCLVNQSVYGVFHRLIYFSWEQGQTAGVRPLKFWSLKFNHSLL